MKEPRGCFIAIVLSCCISLVTLSAQVPAPGILSSPQERNKASVAAQKAGSALIIAAGAFPFAVFYTDFAFDAYRFVDMGFDIQYAPWPFKNQYSAAVSAGERFLRFGAALGLSVAVGLLSVTIPYH